jgi:hypothetical protein
VIALYAVTDAPGRALPDLAPLRVVPSGRLALVYGPAAEGEVSAEALWRHEELVEALMDAGDVLPFRYGTRCEDESAAARVVGERETELAAALERVRGAVELAVRVLVVERPEPRAGRAAPADAAGYVAAKASAAALARAVVDSVHEPLSAMARASHVRAASEPSEALRGAYLVDRERVEEFAAGVASLQSRRPDLRLLCTGPWPPYSFAES